METHPARPPALSANSTGGQFAAQPPKPESEVTLTLTGSRAELTAEIPIKWSTYGLPTPRHRIEQRIINEGFETARIRIVSDAEAPAAFTVPSDTDPNGADIRLVDGTFYRQEQDVTVDPPVPLVADEDWLLNNFTSRQMNDQGDEGSSRRDVTAALQNKILFDGHVWTETFEPVYVVKDGSWVNGPAIEVRTRDPRARCDELVFLADEFDEAVAYAGKVCGEVGAGEAQHMKPLLIHNPSAIGRNGGRVTRIDMPSLDNGYKKHTVDDLNDAKHLMVSRLRNIDGALTETSETQTINFRKLTRKQEAAVRKILIARVDAGIV